MKLYKYITIKSLIRLLKGHQIRLERADLAEMYNENLKKNAYVQDGLYMTYISDWISESTESYALWRMFGNIESIVRIEIDSELIINGIETIFEKDEVNSRIELIRSMFGKEEPVRNNLFSLSNPDKEALLSSISYCDNLQNLLDKVGVDWDNPNSWTGIWDKSKSTLWQHLKESRLMLYRNNPIPQGLRAKERKELEKEWEGESRNIFIQVAFIDILMPDDFIGNVRIKLSPAMSDNNKILITSIRDLYSPNISIEDSSLDFEKFVNL